MHTPFWKYSPYQQVLSPSYRQNSLKKKQMRKIYTQCLQKSFPTFVCSVSRWFLCSVSRWFKYFILESAILCFNC